MGNDIEANRAVEKAIQTAKACNAREIEARALLVAGKIASSSAGAASFLARARKLAQELNQRALEGDIVRWRGNINFWQNNFAESQMDLEQALIIHQEVGDFRGELSALNNLGQLFELLGQIQKAIQYYNQAQEICHKVGDRLAEGVILTNLGGLETQLGHYAQAQGLLESALVIRREIGNDEGVAVVHNDLGDVFRQIGEYQRAFENYFEAISINTRIQHASQKGAVLTSLSVLYRELGAYGQAQACLDEAFHLLTDVASPRYICALVEQSLLYHLLGDHEKALVVGQEAFTKSDRFAKLQAAACKNMGHVLAEIGQWKQAHQNYQQAVSIYHQLSQPRLATKPQSGLAHLAMRMGELDVGVEMTEKILPLITKHPLQGPDRVLWVYLTCYQILHQQQDPRAVDVLKSAHALMNERAAGITDAKLRASYLEDITENREISQMWGNR